MAVEEFIAGIERASIANRSGRRHKPGMVAGYLRDLLGRVVPAFGASRLAEITLPDVQRWPDSLAATGLKANTVRNIINSLRALYGWALPRGLAQVNPRRGLRLPTGEQPRDRVAAPEKADALIRALPPQLQAALGLAVWAGLRLGELLALDWSAVDLEGRTLAVRRSWDHNGHSFVSPKSKAGTRTVPIVETARDPAGRSPRAAESSDRAAVPRRRSGVPDAPDVAARADPERVADGRAGTARLSRGRHRAAWLFIAAGLNVKTISAYRGTPVSRSRSTGTGT